MLRKEEFAPMSSLGGALFGYFGVVHDMNWLRLPLWWCENLGIGTFKLPE
tara:strand:- start:2915 stop:3064 length:150 start_codon:yes stop_codon:yes gene_type:complete